MVSVVYVVGTPACEAGGKGSTPFGLPVIDRYRHLDIPKFFRGDAAFANPALYRVLEKGGYLYTVRLNRPEEIHGFYPVNRIDSECYQAALIVRGTTALYDAAVDAISATNHFATMLAHRGYDVNGVAAIITDGVDYTSVFSPEQVKETLEEAAESEDLASLMSILVGVDLSDAEQSQALNKFQVVSGFRHRIDVADTSERAFLDLADRLSELVLLQRRSVGTKSPES